MVGQVFSASTPGPRRRITGVAGWNGLPVLAPPATENPHRVPESRPEGQRPVPGNSPRRTPQSEPRAHQRRWRNLADRSNVALKAADVRDANTPCHRARALCSDMPRASTRFGESYADRSRGREPTDILSVVRKVEDPRKTELLVTGLAPCALIAGTVLATCRVPRPCSTGRRHSELWAQAHGHMEHSP